MPEQSKALQIAFVLDNADANFYAESSMCYDDKLSQAVGEAADELRRLQAENEALDNIASELQDTCHKQAKRIAEQDTLLRQALEALEILRTGLIQMGEHSESYCEAWARAYVKEYRDLLPGSAEEQFRALNAMQHRLADVADCVVEGFDAITAIRQHLESK